MATFELIMLCVLIPILYVVVYMAGRCDVIGTFLKMSMEAMDTSVEEGNELEIADDIDDAYEMRERVKYLISQFEQARDLVKTGRDLVSLGKVDVLNNVIDILREELLEEEVEDGEDEQS